MKTLFRRIEACEYFGLSNYEICSILKIDEQFLSEYQEDRDRELSRLVAERNKEIPKIQQGINEWLKEPEMVEARKQYLIEAAREAAKDADNPIYNALRYRLRAFLGDSITPEAIERARNHPMTDLLKSRAGMASCPFHEDKSPSMNIKNNFYYCHSCGESGDTIKLLMKRDGLSFKEAVSKLN